MTCEDIQVIARGVAISLEDPLAVGGRSVLANRFGDLHEPELATAAGICLAGVDKTDAIDRRHGSGLLDTNHRSLVTLVGKEKNR